MKNIEVGDIVARKSYGQDIYFRVINIIKSNSKNVMILRGLSERIQADAPESDLTLLGEDFVSAYNKKIANIVDDKSKEIALSGQSKK